MDGVFLVKKVSEMVSEKGERENRIGVPLAPGVPMHGKVQGTV